MVVLGYCPYLAYYTRPDTFSVSGVRSLFRIAQTQPVFDKYADVNLYIYTPCCC